jgi:molybdate transport system substrate-binding protein
MVMDPLKSLRTGSFFTILVICAAVVGCKREESATVPATAPVTSQPEGQTEIRIAAAADLRFALDDLAKTFQSRNPSFRLATTYGSSGNFFSQLSNKAPFDVFLSADSSYPQKLVDQGLASPATLFHYAFGRIVVWVPNESKLDLPSLGLRAVLDASVKKIAIANPEHAPYGRAAVAAMKSAKVYDTAKDRLVLGENISQAAQFVESGSADIGIIAQSLAIAPQMAAKGRSWEVPADAYPPLDQAGVILNWAQDAKAADAFRQFVLSPEARATLSKFGFSPPAK